MAVGLRVRDKCGCGIRTEHLTGREVDVLLLVADDLEDAEIAERLGISVTTVQAHMRSMRRKAGVRSRAGLVARCYAGGVLLPGNFPPHWSGLFCMAARQSDPRRARRLVVTPVNSSGWVGASGWGWPTSAG